MMIIIRALLIMMALSAACATWILAADKTTSPSSPVAGPTRVELKDFGAPEGTKLKDVAAIAELLTVQRPPDLRMAVTLTNGGKDALTILNPVDLLLVTVNDASGHRVSTLPVPKFFINTKGPQQSILNFKVEDMHVDVPGQTVAQQVDVHATSVQLVPGASLKLDLLINHMMKSEDASKPIDAGDYSLKVTLSLITEKDGRSARTIESGLIPVKLTENAK